MILKILLKVAMRHPYISRIILRIVRKGSFPYFERFLKSAFVSKNVTNGPEER